MQPIRGTVWEEERLRETLRQQATGDPGRYLFRGQRKRYSSIVPFIVRDGVSTRQAYTVLIWIVGRLRAMVEALPIDRGVLKRDRKEVIALFQHYGWPTPYLDLTDDVDVAFFFAHDGFVKAEGPAAIYVVDTTLSGKTNHVIVAHDQVVDPSLNLRWSRQRGYAIRAKEWKDLEQARELDLVCQPYVREHLFAPSAGTVASMTGDDRLHYYEADVDVTNQLKFLVDAVAEGTDLCPLGKDLQAFPH